MITLPQCRWRGAPKAGGFGCRSPKLVVLAPVTAATCGVCPYADPEPEPEPAATRRVSLPCVHRSEEPLRAGEAAALELSTLRTWYKCGKGHGRTRRGYVCLYNGDVCGPACAGYAPIPSKET